MAVTDTDSKTIPSISGHFNAQLNHRSTEILHELDSVIHEADLESWFNNSAWFSEKKSDFLQPWNFSKEDDSETLKDKKGMETRTGSDKVDFISSNIRNTKGAAALTDPSLCGYFERTLWRGCVESVTFRYIPNNGKYRDSKVAAQKFAIQKPTKRLGDKVLNSEQKQLQKEIQRELRKEFEMVEKQGHWARSDEKPRLMKYREIAPSTSVEAASGSSSPDHKAIEAVFTAQNSNTRSSQAASKLPPRRSHSPVQLPPISVPLVSNNLVKRKLNESYGSNLDMLREMEDRGRTRSVFHSDVKTKPQRSVSEPPPPTNKGMELSKMPTFELAPTNSEEKPRKPRATIVPHQKRVAKPSDTKNNARPMQHKAWSTKGATPSETNTATEPIISEMVVHNHDNSPGTGEQRPDAESPRGKLNSKLKSRKGSDSDSVSASVAVSQLRYMSASGEVTVIPQFGQDSRTSSAANFYSMLERENRHQDVVVDNDSLGADVRSNKENLHSVIMTNKVISSSRVKPNTNGGSPKKSQSKAMKNVSYLPGSPAKVAQEGFRAVPFGRLKPRDKKQQEAIARPAVDLLPQIAGRKCDMSSTTHRIV